MNLEVKGEVGEEVGTAAICCIGFIGPRQHPGTLHAYEMNGAVFPASLRLAASGKGLWSSGVPRTNAGCVRARRLLFSLP